MRCFRCHTKMERDRYTHTATCPKCGRVAHYKTRAEKKESQRLEDEAIMSFLKECWATFWENITTIVSTIVVLIIFILLVFNK